MESSKQDSKARGNSDGRAPLCGASAVASSEAGATPRSVTGGGNAGPNAAGGPAVHELATGGSNPKPKLTPMPLPTLGRGSFSDTPEPTTLLAPPNFKPSPAANLQRVYAKTGGPPPPPPLPRSKGDTSGSDASQAGNPMADRKRALMASSPRTGSAKNDDDPMDDSDLSLSSLDWSEEKGVDIFDQVDQAPAGKKDLNDKAPQDHADNNSCHLEQLNAHERATKKLAAAKESKRRLETSGSSTGTNSSVRLGKAKSTVKQLAKRPAPQEDSPSQDFLLATPMTAQPEAASNVAPRLGQEQGTVLPPEHERDRQTEAEKQLSALNPPTHPPKKRSRGNRESNPELESYSTMAIKRLKIALYLEQRQLKHKDFLHVDKAIRKSMLERIKRREPAISLLRSGLFEGVLTLTCRKEADLDIFEDIIKSIQPPETKPGTKYIIVTGERSNNLLKLNCKISDPDIYDELDSFKILIREYNPTLANKTMIVTGRVPRPNDKDNTVLKLLVDVDFCKELSKLNWKADFGITKIPFWVPTYKPTPNENENDDGNPIMEVDNLPPTADEEEGNIDTSALIDLFG